MIKEIEQYVAFSKIHGFKTGTINLGGLRIGVVIKDVKERWGKLRFLVEPIRGTGEIWVENVVLA